jgi:hypothetical protein
LPLLIAAAARADGGLAIASFVLTIPLVATAILAMKWGFPARKKVVTAVISLSTISIVFSLVAVIVLGVYASNQVAAYNQAASNYGYNPSSSSSSSSPYRPTGSSSSSSSSSRPFTTGYPSTSIKVVTDGFAYIQAFVGLTASNTFILAAAAAVGGYLAWLLREELSHHPAPNKPVREHQAQSQRTYPPLNEAPQQYPPQQYPPQQYPPQQYPPQQYAQFQGPPQFGRPHYYNQPQYAQFPGQYQPYTPQPYPPQPYYAQMPPEQPAQQAPFPPQQQGLQLPPPPRPLRLSQIQAQAQTQPQLQQQYPLEPYLAQPAQPQYLQLPLQGQFAPMPSQSQPENAATVPPPRPPRKNQLNLLQ